MTALDVFKRIESGLPEGAPELTRLHSGGLLLDFTICGTRYCAEYFPEHDVYGLSKLEGSSPFWEGVEELFQSGQELEARILEISRGDLSR